MKKNVTTSIKGRMLLPLSAILVFQMVFLVLFYQFGGVLSTLQNNAVQLFSETTRHSKLNMERDLMTYWMSSISSADDIPQRIEQILEEQGAEPGDIADDPALNSAILSGVTGRLIDILHYSYGNGIYLVLDGPASVNGSPDEQAGVFVRDMDASNYELDRSDLLLECGLPSLARTYGIALDSFWELGLDLTKMEDDRFYTEPFRCAVEGQVKPYNAGWCSYLGLIRTPGQKQTTNLSYSMPIILSDGSVVGVVGGEISAHRIRQLLVDDLDRNDSSVITLLAWKQGDTLSFDPIIGGSAQYQHYFGAAETVPYEDSGWDSVGTVRDLEGNTWYAALEPLMVYDPSAPFADESWLVVRLSRSDDLFRNINTVHAILLSSVVFSMVVGFVVLLLASHMITNPIRRLMHEMQRVDFRHRPHLHKIKIREIDELVDEVNRLSASVIDHASKTSQILDALDMEIGAFEYEAGSDEVFCSHSLLELMGIHCDDGMYQFVSQKAFLEMISHLTDPVADEDGTIYQFHGKEDLRYIRLKIMETESDETIGVLMDITPEINERKRLEQERDGDMLTGLYNRRAFQARVEPMLEGGALSPMAFVMWDMDNLKYVNDTYGHEAGDRYICMFADHLRTLEDAGAIVERRSGDEFMAVLYNGGEQELMQRVRDFMEQLKAITMVTPDGYRIPLRASAGVAWYPRQGTAFEDLTRYADFAMYMSKHSYKGIVQEFDEETYETNAYLLSGREELNQILERGSVDFALQPIVARSGEIFGYEVLMRPALTKLKNISELLHLTKIQAKLPQFEELTWFGALAWLRARADRLAEGSRFFINSIANVQMDAAKLRKLEEAYGDLLPRVVLELTETEEANTACLDSKTSAIHRWGGLLALDDYGAGYSNESTLLQIEPDVVKMDLSLVRGIHENPNQQAIAKHLVAYSHQRNILVLAEGVETREELAYLMGIQVDLFQGYYLARPELELQPLPPGVVQTMRELAQLP